MYIQRDFEELFAKTIQSRKVLVVYGSRQTGKTTIIEKVLSAGDIRKDGIVSLNGDVKLHRDMLDCSLMTPEKARSILGNSKILFVDEAQKILDIGIVLKIIHDNLKDVKIVATGSSSFELSEEICEPLTGRMASYILPPISFTELARINGNASEMAMLDVRLRLGSYPDIVTSQTEEEAAENLNQLCDAYLFKDVLKWKSVKNSEMLGRLLKALALQVGDEVSYRELGEIVGINNETVESYVERLEKSFVVFRLSAFSRNLRNELKKSRKIYFCDNGVRNGILRNYLPSDCRDDLGHLFENYLISERIKNNNVRRRAVRCYFWRTSQPSDGEIDFIEENANGDISAYEFKLNPAKAARAKCPERFKKAYPNAKWYVVSKDNYVGFVSGEY